MQVQMTDRLPAIDACIHDNAIPRSERLVSRNLGGDAKQMSEHRGIPCARLSQRSNVGARHDEYVHRRLRMDIREGKALFILINSRRGDASIHDFAEEAAHGSISVQERRLVGSLLELINHPAGRVFSLRQFHPARRAALVKPRSSLLDGANGVRRCNRNNNRENLSQA
jgi:hypothetical protein